jgi:type 1 fimbria pilin
MKKLIIGLVGSLLLLTVAFAAPKDSTYSGEIMDSQCAKKEDP